MRLATDVREALNMIVMKFGGTSVEDAQAIRRLVTIVRGRIRQQPVVVSSAMSGVTDTLLQATVKASSGNDPATSKLLQHLEARHIATAHDLVRNYHQTEITISGLFDELRPLLTAVCRQRRVSPQLSDRVASFGERLSTVLVSAALEESGIASTLLDARECIVTDDHFTRATPLMNASKDRLRARLIPLLHSKRVPVLGGFIAATVGGQTTTLGRGGSDFTAALVGGALDAKRVEIWTDVDGIRTTDPRLYPQARHIESISFHEAAELARLGAKVLHPSTLLPVMDKNIPVYVLNSRNPLHPGTCVRAESHGIAGVKAIAVKHGVTLVEARTDRFFRPSVLARDMLSIMEANGCVPDIVSISSASITVSVDNKGVVGCLRAELAERVKLKAENSKALVSLVADDVRRVVGLPARVCSSLGGIEVWIASPGASHRSFSFVVSEKDVPDVVRRLHESLLQDNPSLPKVRTEEKFDSGLIA